MSEEKLEQERLQKILEKFVKKGEDKKVEILKVPENAEEYELVVAGFNQELIKRDEKISEWKDLAMKRDREILILSSKFEETQEKLQIAEINIWKNKDIRSKYAVKDVNSGINYRAIKIIIKELDFKEMDLKGTDIEEVRCLGEIFRSLSRQFNEIIDVEYKKRLLESSPWKLN